MKYVLGLFLLFIIFAPAPAKATCNCAEYNYVTMYCIELGCSGHRTVLDCGGLYHDSCIACYGGVNPIPCCPNAPIYGARIGGSCDIVIAEQAEPVELYVRAFVTSCDGTLVRAVVGLPREAMAR
jgi:hypothetical protein